MGSVGDCFDNALSESFFATLECELLDRRAFHTQIEARMAVFDFLEGWYNHHRRHSALGRSGRRTFRANLANAAPPASHSQITRTLHPSASSASRCALSLAAVRSSFGAQYA